LHAQSPYAATKIGADQLALSYHLSFGVPVVVARPFNTYGPRQSLRAVIPTIIGQLAAGEKRVRLGNLESTRDFNFVADTVSGFLAAADAKDPEALGEVFNLGTGFDIRIGDLVEEIAEILGKPATVEIDSARLRPDASEVMRLQADASKAARLLKWRPEYAGLEGLRRGLRETARWFSDPGNLSAYKTAQYAV
jgi:dTDP-glucose 4,6-dehydratase